MTAADYREAADAAHAVLTAHYTGRYALAPHVIAAAKAARAEAEAAWEVALAAEAAA